MADHDDNIINFQAKVEEKLPYKIWEHASHARDVSPEEIRELGTTVLDGIQRLRGYEANPDPRVQEMARSALAYVRQMTGPPHPDL